MCRLVEENTGKSPMVQIPVELAYEPAPVSENVLRGSEMVRRRIYARGFRPGYYQYYRRGCRRDS